MGKPYNDHIGHPRMTLIKSYTKIIIKDLRQQSLKWMHSETYYVTCFKRQITLALRKNKHAPTKAERARRDAVSPLCAHVRIYSVKCLHALYSSSP